MCVESGMGMLEYLLALLVFSTGMMGLNVSTIGGKEGGLRGEPAFDRNGTGTRHC